MKTATDHKPLPVPCCPELITDKACDVLDFHYRTIHRAVVDNRTVAVEVLIHARLERCPGPMALGDLVYSNTLLPGEKVRLFTNDRRSQFSFDSSTSLSYRNVQTSEEQYYMSSMSDSMSDITVRDETHSSNRSQGSTEGHASTSGAIETVLFGPSVDVAVPTMLPPPPIFCINCTNMCRLLVGAQNRPPAQPAVSASVKYKRDRMQKAKARIISNRRRANSPITTSVMR